MMVEREISPSKSGLNYGAKMHSCAAYIYRLGSFLGQKHHNVLEGSIYILWTSNQLIPLPFRSLSFWKLIQTPLTQFTCPIVQVTRTTMLAFAFPMEFLSLICLTLPIKANGFMSEEHSSVWTIFSLNCFSSLGNFPLCEERWYSSL